MAPEIPGSPFGAGSDPGEDEVSSFGSDSSVISGFTNVTYDRVPAGPSKGDERPEDRMEKVLKWLQPTDYLSPGGEFQKHLRAHVKGTGKWMKGQQVYRKWMTLGASDGEEDDEDTDVEMVDVDEVAEQDGDYPLLYVRGVAGSGKSVFSASTIRRLQEASDDHIVLFFFFRQIVDRNHTARYLVRDFAAQLLPHSPSLLSALWQLSKTQPVRGNELTLIWSSFVVALENDAELLRGRVFCVTDALDEMDECDLDVLVAKLMDLATPRDAGRPALARVLMTSRPISRIENVVLRHPRVARVRLDPARLSPDVERYVDARMDDLLREGLLGANAESKSDLIRQTICARAKGLFLHARLALDNLAEALREGQAVPGELPERLDELLPSTLYSVYEGMLREHARRSGLTTDQQAQLLACVARARRPLRLIELGSLVARLMGDGDLRRGKDLVRTGCGRLLELLEDETVSVIHHSFTEFLNDPERNTDSTTAGFPVLSDIESHAMLAQLLLQYLNRCSPSEVAVIDDLPTPNCDHYDSEKEYDEPREWWNEKYNRKKKAAVDAKVEHQLSSYATESLIFHISKVPPGTPAADQVLVALDQYLIPGKPAFQALMLLNWKGPMSASCTVLHLLCGHEDARLVPDYIMEHLINRDPELIDTPDLRGMTPLSYAAEEGQTRLVEMLLRAGADPTSGKNTSMGYTPFHRAIVENHEAVVRLFLEAGVDPFLKTWPVIVEYSTIYVSPSEQEATAEEERITALELAFKRAGPKVIRVFLPFVPDGEIDKLMHETHKAESLRAILETGKADVNSVWEGTTKLFAAARDRCPEMVRVLLEYGADPMKRCPGKKYYGFEYELSRRPERQATPLHALSENWPSHDFYFSSERSARECLRLLLAAGADINATMDTYHEQNVTPLHLAVKARGGADVARDLTEGLLAAGANPNARTEHGNTALHLAWANMSLLELLVEHGADINARNSAGRTPLLELLVQECRRGSFRDDKPDASVFLKLLELGADPNDADNEGNTVLHYVLSCMDCLSDTATVPLVKELLRTGLDPNRRNTEGKSAIWRWPLKYNSPYTAQGEEILRLLLDAGMDLNLRDHKGQTVLFEIAQRQDSIQTVQLLVGLGADPTILDNDGRSLLHAAMKFNSGDIEALVALGVPVDTVDKDGNTILHELSSRSVVSRGPVQALIAAGVSPLARNFAGETVLHVANDSDTVDFWLNMPAFHGFDLNEQDSNGLTLMHHLAWCSNETMWKLIRAGGDIDAVTPKGMSLLHFAASRGSPSTVGLLLAQYRDRGTLEKHINRLGDGRTALHYACQMGSYETVWTLLHYGADARIPDERGLQPLHTLAEFEEPEKPWLYHRQWWRAGGIVKLLKLAGADLNAEAAVPTGDGTETRMVTPLDLAVERKRWEMVRRLIEHGAEPRDHHKTSEEFILATDKVKAAEKTREVMKVLSSSIVRGGFSKHGRPRWRGRWAVSQDPTPSEPSPLIACGKDMFDATEAPDGPGSDKVDPDDLLHFLLTDGDYDSIKEYAELGGDVLWRERSMNLTFLHKLASEGEADLFEFFADKVVKLEAQERELPSEKRGGTLLGTACHNHHPSLHVLHVLVDKVGVDVNAIHDRKMFSYEKGRYALHVLAEARHFWQIEAVEYLLSRGADIEARDDRGFTPLLVAVSEAGFWCEQVVRVLLKHGADVNATVLGEGDKRGATALGLSSRPDITKILLEHGAKVHGFPGTLRCLVAECMSPDVAKLLLEAGMDPNELPHPQTKETRYALHEAARPNITDEELKSRQDAMIELLLSHGADPYASYADGRFVLQAIVEERGKARTVLSHLQRLDCNRKGRHGRTLLISACMSLVPLGPAHWNLSPEIMADVVLALIDAGADPLLTDDTGRTPLHWFCTYQGELKEEHRDAFRALLAHGPAAIDIADTRGQKPLHVALSTYANRSQTSAFMVQHLLSLNADPTEPDPETGNTTLHYLAPRLVGEKTAAAEATSLFREVATRVDINARNKAGETPLFPFAAAEWPVTKDPESRSSYDHEQYAKAHDIKHYSAIEVFLSLGADIKATDNHGRTLLHVTADRQPDYEYYGRVNWGEEIVDTFKKLMELGLDPRAEDKEMRTPIDVAVARDWKGIVQLFSEDGED